jgi:hypothetical protein
MRNASSVFYDDWASHLVASMHRENAEATRSRGATRATTAPRRIVRGKMPASNEEFLPVEENTAAVSAAP